MAANHDLWRISVVSDHTKRDCNEKQSAATSAKKLRRITKAF